MKTELLPDDLVWAAGGHASDVVLTALADGQIEIVPANARAHVDGCRACTMHLGNAALLSLHAGREIATLLKAAPEKRELPRLAIALGLLVAALGIAPSLVDIGADAHGAETWATHDVPALARGASTLFNHVFASGSSVGLVITYGAAAMLFVMALAVVRLLPKKEVSR